MFGFLSTILSNNITSSGTKVKNPSAETGFTKLKKLGAVTIPGSIFFLSFAISPYSPPSQIQRAGISYKLLHITLHPLRRLVTLGLRYVIEGVRRRREGEEEEKDVKTVMKEKVMGVVEGVKRRLSSVDEGAHEVALTGRGLALRLFFDFGGDTRVTFVGGRGGLGGGREGGSKKEEKKKKKEEEKKKKKKRRSLDVFMQGLQLMSPKGAGV
ncbi:hypothetical protein TrRE_jg7115 [Triparma retinervis]|uniref:Uncharacterized protein n=1 Tax=Triparma retinervis TaxID=2557542 RepID=A0A9W6ZUK4_9STRA|nr:hypothetical protein TrRE_jg7115 [Triparma retinervis]